MYWKRAAYRQLNISPDLDGSDADPEDRRVGPKFLFEFEQKRKELEKALAESKEEGDLEKAIRASQGEGEIANAKVEGESSNVVAKAAAEATSEKAIGESEEATAESGEDAEQDRLEENETSAMATDADYQTRDTIVSAHEGTDINRLDDLVEDLMNPLQRNP
jgi:hypothetical protein